MVFNKYCFNVGLAFAFCALSVVRVSAQQPSKPSGGSIIQGRVIYADTGRPLRRADISLVTHDTENWVDHSISDRNGEFVFKNISAGRYFLLVSALDIVSTEVPLSLKIALGEIEDGYSEVTTDGRSTVKTEIRASRGGVITGRVMTESDEPIAKAEIRLFQVKSGKLSPAAVTAHLLDSEKHMFETDSRGAYRIAGLPTGEYIVRASESNEGGNPDDASEGSYTDGSLMVAFYPKALRVQDATSVKVQQGSETKDVDIRFTERIAHRVSGTILVRGKPVQGAEIRLMGDEPEVDKNSSESAQARTDDKGEWEIRAVPDGKYTLSVSAGVVGMVQLDDKYGPAEVPPLRRELVVEGGDVTNLRLELAEAGQLQGIVSVEGGTHVPELLIVKLVSTAPSRKPDTDDDAAAATLVDEKGTFTIRRIPPGSFHFGMIGLGDRYYVKSITLKGTDALRTPLKIESGKLLGGVSIVLATDLVSVSGRVVEKADKSKTISNAAVLLFPVETERRRMSDGPIIVSSDKDGRFAVKGAPGEYFVFVVNRRRGDLPVELPTETSLIKNASTLQKINLQRGDEKRVVEVVGP